MSIQALREQRAAKAKALKELVEKPKWDVAVDQPIYDAAMAEIDEIDASIKRIGDANERLAESTVNDNVREAVARVTRDKAGQTEGSELFNKWLRGGDRALSAEDFQKIRNAVSTTTQTEGGFTVQNDVATTILDALKAFGGMREVAEVMRTTAGNSLNFPTSDGTSEVGELIAENVSATVADVTFGTKSLPVFKYSSRVVAVPIELLQDSNVDIEAFVRQRLVTRIGRITNTHFTIGDGSSKPLGIMPAASVGITAGNGTSQVTTVLYDTLVDLVHSVDPAYRALGNCRFMMNDLSIRQLRKIKDGQARPIFVPGYELNVPGGAPDRLLGYPIQINQDVAVMAANARSIAFGDFSFYKIRDVMDIQMMRFTDSAFARLGQVGFLAFMRSGGNFVDVGGAVRVFVNAAS